MKNFYKVSLIAYLVSASLICQATSQESALSVKGGVSQPSCSISLDSQEIDLGVMELGKDYIRNLKLIINCDQKSMGYFTVKSAEPTHAWAFVGSFTYNLLVNSNNERSGWFFMNVDKPTSDGQEDKLYKKWIGETIPPWAISWIDREGVLSFGIPGKELIVPIRLVAHLDDPQPLSIPTDTKVTGGVVFTLYQP